MPVALGVLPTGEEPLRHDKMQIILGAGHCDIEQSALFFELGGGAGAEIGRDTAVDGVLQILHHLAVFGPPEMLFIVIAHEQSYRAPIAPAREPDGRLPAGPGCRLR